MYGNLLRKTMPLADDTTFGGLECVRQNSGRSHSIIHFTGRRETYWSPIKVIANRCKWLFSKKCMSTIYRRLSSLSCLPKKRARGTMTTFSNSRLNYCWWVHGSQTAQLLLTYIIHWKVFEDLYTHHSNRNIWICIRTYIYIKVKCRKWRRDQSLSTIQLILKRGYLIAYLEI